MRIVVVEDDSVQAGGIREALQEGFPHAEFRQINTESEFRSSLEELAADPPAAIVLDVMLRWADPAPDLPPRPEDVVHEGFSRAGIRCMKLLRQNERTKHVAVILYTVLDSNTLGVDLERVPPSVRYLQKGSGYAPLVEVVRELTRPGRGGQAPG